MQELNQIVDADGRRTAPFNRPDFASQSGLKKRVNMNTVKANSRLLRTSFDVPPSKIVI